MQNMDGPHSELESIVMLESSVFSYEEDIYIFNRITMGR